MNLLLNEKPCKLLRTVGRKGSTVSINEIGKDCYTTYKSRYKVILQLHELGYVSLERPGREVVVSITRKGLEAIKHLSFFN